MDIDVKFGPANAAARVKLSPSETLTTESGAMIAMSGDMDIQTTTHKKNQGGFLKALKRLLANESMFLNHFTAGSAGGEVWIGPVLSGDMMSHELTTPLIVQGGSFLACEQTVDVDVGWQGFKNFVSGESLFWIQLTGMGKVVLNAFGGIYCIEVDGDHIVDTGHIVAFEEGLDFKITKSGGSWISSFLGGEGFVCKFHGKGRVWCQSHNASSYGQKLGSMLRARKG